MDAVLARSAVQRFERPTTMREAHRIVSGSDGSARLVGGGTDLALHLPGGVTTLVDLSGLSLSYIERRPARIAIGATTTLATLADDPSVAGLAGGLLGTVLGHVGSHALRNVATIGGHLARAHMSDLVPAMLVMDAEVSVFDGAEHRVALDEFYRSGWHRRQPLITEVTLPVPDRAPASGFVRFSRTSFDYAILNVAVVVHQRDGAIERALIAVGETPELGRRVADVEAFLSGRQLDDATIDGASRLAAEHVPTGDDQRASAAYRSTLVGVGVRRALLMAAGREEVEP